MSDHMNTVFNGLPDLGKALDAYGRLLNKALDANPLGDGSIAPTPENMKDRATVNTTVQAAAAPFGGLGDLRIIAIIVLAGIAGLLIFREAIAGQQKVILLVLGLLILYVALSGNLAAKAASSAPASVPVLTSITDIPSNIPKGAIA